MDNIVNIIFSIPIIYEKKLSLSSIFFKEFLLFISGRGKSSTVFLKLTENKHEGSNNNGKGLC